jgi:hypothetical protein
MAKPFADLFVKVLLVTPLSVAKPLVDMLGVGSVEFIEVNGESPQ